MQILKILSFLCLGCFIVSCAYFKKITGSKEDQVNLLEGPGSEDIVNMDMESDNKGSDSGTIDGLGTVFFALDSSTLSAETKETLQKNAEWLNNNPQVVRMELEGHCDPLGSEAYNIGLGQRRAESVKNYLQNILGVSSEKLSIISYGEEKLLSEIENHLNRRVNFVPVY